MNATYTSEVGDNGQIDKNVAYEQQLGMNIAFVVSV